MNITKQMEEQYDKMKALAIGAPVIYRGGKGTHLGHANAQVVAHTPQNVIRLKIVSIIEQGEDSHLQPDQIVSALPSELVFDK